MPFSSLTRVSLVDQVITQLHNLIESGEWPVGSRIPTEAELAPDPDLAANAAADPGDDRDGRLHARARQSDAGHRVDRVCNARDRSGDDRPDDVQCGRRALRAACGNGDRGDLGSGMGGVRLRPSPDRAPRRVDVAATGARPRPGPDGDDRDRDPFNEGARRGSLPLNRGQVPSAFRAADDTRWVSTSSSMSLLVARLARRSRDVPPQCRSPWLIHRAAWKARCSCSMQLPMKRPVQLLTRGTTPQRGGTPTNEHNV